MIWLGTRRGYLSDWLTQQWVRTTGRHVEIHKLSWLSGPTGTTAGIGPQFFDDYAARAGFEILSGEAPRGLVKDLTAVLGGARVDPAVSAFYERTSEFQMDCWSEWSSVFRPFGRLLALVFSRRLEQLNVPLGGLDTHRGISSRVLVMRAPQGELQTAWVRQLLASKRTLYAGSYSTCGVPGYAGCASRFVSRCRMDERSSLCAHKFIAMVLLASSRMAANLATPVFTLSLSMKVQLGPVRQDDEGEHSRLSGGRGHGPSRSYATNLGPDLSSPALSVGNKTTGRVTGAPHRVADRLKYPECRRSGSRACKTRFPKSCFLSERLNLAGISIARKSELLHIT